MARGGDRPRKRRRRGAVERGLRVAGLHGLVAPDSRAADLAVAEQEGGYRLAMDPLANVVGSADLIALAR